MNNYNTDYLKRSARRIKIEKGVPHHEALDLAAQGVGFENWQHFLRLQTASIPAVSSGILIRIKPFNCLAVTVGPISKSVRSYTHSGDLLCTRPEISICRDQSEASSFRPIRIVLPYGKWTCSDGTEVLFNRDYRPLWKKHPDGTVVDADPDEWVSYSNQEYFYGDHNTPVDDADSHRICTSQLQDWGVEHEVPAMLNLFRQATRAGDLSIMKKRSIYYH